MLRRAIWVPAVWALLAAPAVAQLQNDLSTVLTVRVKPDKVGQFETLVKKMVAANRQNNGTVWLATKEEFGENHTIRFSRAHANFASIERSSQAFIAAMHTSYGEAATEQILHDANSSIVSARSEIRRQRWDLSSDPPADAAARPRAAGEARWLQSTMVRARPGHGSQVEELIRMLKVANERATPKISTRVLQAVAGQTDTVYYVGVFRRSLSELDDAPPMAQLLGEAHGTFEKTMSDSVVTIENSISRFRPELSNPSEAIAVVAPEFWRPKP